MLGRISRPQRFFPLRRHYADDKPTIRAPLRGQLFVDALPVRLGIWDPRHYFAVFREDHIFGVLRARLSNVVAHGFTIVDIQPYYKDGGAFVTFEYTASDSENAIRTIEAELKEEVAKRGGLPSWWQGARANVWLVKGKPWTEDMWRFPTQFVNVAFEGPDIREERLYHLFRPYGVIIDIQQPTSFPAGTLRSSNVLFKSLRYATIARNTIHGLEVSTPESASTRLHLTYSPPFHPHKIQEWLTNHPKIVLPIIIFLLGSLTYTIFDPIRSFMIQAKMQDWFDIREFRIYQWLRAKSVELRIYTPAFKTSSKEEVWKERELAEKDVRRYLEDWPSTIAFMHGPQGSGKSRLLNNVLTDSERTVLTVDCRPLQNATSDAQLLTVIARQVGYWPVFSFFNSANHIIDLASVGLIGQKGKPVIVASNLSSSLPDQVREMLSVVRIALDSVKASHQRDVQRKARRTTQAEARALADALHLERIRRGTWHDGRLDCIAGNGIMAELGVGDELFDDDISIATVEVAEIERQQRNEQEIKKKEKGNAELGAVESLPVVVIRNFDGSTREEIFDVIAEWAASLVEQQLAHVVVVTDNRENSKRLAKALPSKPLQTIALSDADEASALAFVKRKLKDAGINLEYTREQVASVQCLGGRASDLESLIHKVRNGVTLSEAVEDIIARGVSELRKNAFGDDEDDAKNLPWSREETWSLFKLLSKQAEVPYHDVLLDFPFKGDEASLRSMERAELITIATHNAIRHIYPGRPSTIRPGRPVYRYVFERLVNDPIFQATQDIAFNEKIIAGAESTIKACEQELLSLKEIGTQAEHWWGGNTASSSRSRYLLSKMQVATMKIEALERRNVELKMVLAKGG
ncbi:RNA12 protein-domain-containing protein [Mycena pura]|uniref:Mitochondrial escape protein 2 n=1 Tax=Mycena pura TaxID=153505 RepID=A0AAD6V1K7_9AGAR|nr:RNA12 protein-domain-containing protein [Mycena pura]